MFCIAGKGHNLDSIEKFIGGIITDYDSGALFEFRRLPLSRN